jgi:threonine synthase
VVVISTASGLKFPDFKVGYHQGTLEEIADIYANHPVVLPAEYEAVKRAALDGIDAASR